MREANRDRSAPHTHTTCSTKAKRLVKREDKAALRPWRALGTTMVLRSRIAMERQALNLHEWPALGCRDVDLTYQKLECIGVGSYGQVFKAKSLITGEIVALKKIRKLSNGGTGIPLPLLREIKLLQQLPPHPNIIKLKEIVLSFDPLCVQEKPSDDVAGIGEPPLPSLESAHASDDMESRQAHEYNNAYAGRDADKARKKKRGRLHNMQCGSIYMVFEYMHHDLSGLLKRPGIKLTLPQVKCYMHQLLTGLRFLHTHGVIHRDIKGSNLLINNDGILKIADFGLARKGANYQHDSNNCFVGRADLTLHVVTRWYRPPELLLGCTQYGAAVDMWSAGCVFAELLQGNAIFPGESEMDQLHKICELCGYPDETSWPGVTQLPSYKKLRPTSRMSRKIRRVLGHFEVHVLDLIERMLVLDPKQRITAGDALESECFLKPPLPCSPSSLPKYEESHTLGAKIKQYPHMPPK